MPPIPKKRSSTTKPRRPSSKKRTTTGGGILSSVRGALSSTSSRLVGRSTGYSTPKEVLNAANAKAESLKEKKRVGYSRLQKAAIGIGMTTAAAAVLWTLYRKGNRQTLNEDLKTVLAKLKNFMPEKARSRVSSVFTELQIWYNKVRGKQGDGKACSIKYLTNKLTRQGSALANAVVNDTATTGVVQEQMEAAHEIVAAAVNSSAQSQRSTYHSPQSQTA